MRVARTLAIVAAGTLAVPLAGYLWVQWASEQGFGTGDLEFSVPKGATLAQIGAKLHAEGRLKSTLAWRAYLKLHPDAPAPKAGRHALNGPLSIPQLLEALSQKPLSEDVPLTMVEGWRLRDADAWMAERQLITQGAYIQAAHDKEAYKIPFSVPGDSLAGYLLPDTYLVPKGSVDVKRLIQRQIDAFHERFETPFRDEIAQAGRTLQEIVVMASMLEREEPNPASRPEVAGVLYKRLDAKVPLGVDATSRFNLKDWNNRRALLRALRDPDDPYNTRLKPGLPPGPIGAPSLNALTAAVRPVGSPYWYYLHDRTKKIHFARTAEEHEANRRRYNVW